MPNSPVLPSPIQTFVDSTNAAESDAFVAAFTEDAYLEDWGREFHGREGAASWNSTDNIGVHAHFEVASVEPGSAPGTYVVTAAVTGDGYNGLGTFDFTVVDGLISRMVIS